MFRADLKRESSCRSAEESPTIVLMVAAAGSTTELLLSRNVILPSGNRCSRDWQCRRVPARVHEMRCTAAAVQRGRHLVDQLGLQTPGPDRTWTVPVGGFLFSKSNLT